MSNFKGQEEDQIPLMNISYVKVSKTEVQKDDGNKLNKILNLIFTNLIYGLIVLLSVLLISYASVLAPKNTYAYLLSSKGYGSFGLTIYILTLVSLIAAFTFKYLKTYFLSDEKKVKLFDYLYIAFMYITFVLISYTFYLIPLRASIAEKLKQFTGYGIIILSIVSVCSIVMIVLNALDCFTKIKIAKLKIINITVPSVVSWIFAIGYSIYNTRFSLAKGSYIVFVAPILLLVGLVLTIKSEKKEKFNYMKLLSDAFIFTAVCLTLYVIFKYGILNYTNIA